MLIIIQSNRTTMSKLMLSIHQLMIERGRWLKIITENIFCAVCYVIDDEFHVIFICPRYTDIRN